MNKTMNKTKMQTFSVCKLAVTALFGLAVTLVSCSNEEIVQNQKTAIENGKDLTTFETGEPESSNTKTRTSLDYASGAFYWEAGDKIYVKDDDDTWQVSSNAPTEKTASFKFKVPGRFTGSNTYKVYYPGKNGNQDRVSIPAAQTQTAPDNTEHIGSSGDCGIATATKEGGLFKFKLDHKPAILVFQPYTSNTILQGCYLTKVEVTSDNNLTGTYTLDPATGTLTGTGSGSRIVLTTKNPAAGSANANGFPLTNTSASVATNGAYMVIAPGTHTLRVRYWIKDPVTNNEGTITKVMPSFTYAANAYYDMTANLTIHDYAGDKYYMWDAQRQYWYGHEWNKTGYVARTDQPTVNERNGSAYPLSKYLDPDRWCNESYPGRSIRNDAVQPHFTSLPNVNELVWYCMKGDPHWDYELWTSMGHLHRGGIWLKKKSEIPGFTPNNDPDGIDWRADPIKAFPGFHKIGTTLPPIPAADADKYFFLPALGSYEKGMLNYIGMEGCYWSSSSCPDADNEAYMLEFEDADYIRVRVLVPERTFGFRAQEFE
ncbi:hypothetical protein [Prevotella denticola]|uniref:hypothetical protein n=1 Tax=Prevotella denticola TaxID=28129 RepID=UPI003C733FF4